MPDRRPFSHILFDLDHTLTFYSLSTAGVIAEALRRTSSPDSLFGPLEEAAARYDALWIRMQRDTRSVDELRLRIWRAMAEENGVSTDGVAGRMASEYAVVRRSHGPRLVAGVRDLLRDLRAAGRRLGLLTNGEGYLQWETIRSLGVQPLFDAIAVAGDIGVYKPDPRAFSILLERLDAPAKRALFVGDSYEMDVVGAHAAGIASAWIRPDGTRCPGPAAPTYELASVLEVRKITLGAGA